MNKKIKTIIVNADDFGISPGINQGILQCYREGIVRSTSLMANLPAFADGVRIAKENPGLSVGVH
ncbi:MAG: ChbG/HpnK family deacetylase, partial [Deltaproteobacteria bacterium]|nr:ChbG/HpnK family deacetylase [Deltaproteobacteria bacterium]